MPMTEKSVRDMNVVCSLQVRNFDKIGKTMSDCCQAPATSAVQDPGSRYWLYRCNAHRGIALLEQRGAVRDTFPVNEDDET